MQVSRPVNAPFLKDREGFAQAITAGWLGDHIVDTGGGGTAFDTVGAGPVSIRLAGLRRISSSVVVRSAS